MKNKVIDKPKNPENLNKLKSYFELFEEKHITLIMVRDEKLNEIISLCEFEEGQDIVFFERYYRESILDTNHFVQNSAQRNGMFGMLTLYLDNKNIQIIPQNRLQEFVNKLSVK